MNLALHELPARCDVLVVGAGPAGSAAAITLAKAGLAVTLIDQHAFPRDKVCGDGLIPDTHAALRKLGVLDAVMAQAQRVAHVRCVGPRGGQVDVPGTLAVLPRRQLDDLLCRAAVKAGATMAAPVRFVAPLERGGSVVGATLKSGELTREIEARWVLLATGGVPQALMAAGMCERPSPSGVAMRAYVKNPAMRDCLKSLDIVWHRALRPGYGWIFPCGNDVYNLGVGLSQSHDEADGRKKGGVNLREVYDAFQRVYEPARALMDGGTLLAEPKGAPMRYSLEGARHARPGLLVAGEAAGSTYAFTGEGIGKAMETGMLAAEALLRHRDDDAVACSAYEASLAALKPRFALYRRANLVNAQPWLADLVIWRASRSPRILRRMAGVLDETSNPGQLFTMRGMLRLFTE
jgi:geranylgeranyl reductase family protein